MAIFTYVAKRPDGSNDSGVIEADDEKQALEMLRARQCWVVGISREKPPRVGLWQRLFYRVKPGSLAIFYGGLLESVRAGISMPAAMEVVWQTRGPRYLRHAAGEMIEPLRRGDRLSRQMAKRPTLFPTICTQLIMAGEESGRLEAMLEVCRDYADAAHDTEQAVKAATLYPKILIGLAALVVVAFIAVMAWLRSTSLIPAESNPITESGTGVFMFVGRSLAILVLVLVGAIIIYRLLSVIPLFRRGFDEVKMFLPGIAGITGRLVYSRFAKTFATCYAAGLSLPRSVEIASDACGNAAVRERLSRAVPALLSGVKLSEALGAVAQLPAVISQVIITGETTGRLDETLRRAAGIFDREAAAGIKGMVLLIGIGSWAVVAGIILYAYISFWVSYGNIITNFEI